MNQDPSNKLLPRQDLATEQALLVNAQAGDPYAGGDLMGLYLNEITSFATNRVGSNDAEDIAQQVAEKTIRHLDNLDDRDPGIGPWLFRVARTTTIDHYRRRSETPYKHEDLEHHFEPVPDHQESYADHAALESALSQIKPEHADVIRALYYEDEPLNKYAKRMGIADGTAKSRHFNAKRALKKLLTEPYEID